MATIRRTGGSDFPDKLKALVTGPPKSGKTTLLGTVPNIIVLDTEERANNLASLAHLDIPYITINSSADLRECLMIFGNDSLRQQAAAAAGMERIDAVAIDTLDTFQKILKRERMEEQKASKFYRDDWSWMKEEMTKIVEAFTALPLHVIFTVHQGTKNIGTEENPVTKVLPGLEGAIATDIAGMVGYSLRSFRREEVGPNGKYTKYWLQAEGDEIYDFLGTRTAGRLPSIIEPDFGKIYEAAMANRPTGQHDAAQVQMPQAPAQAPQAPQAPPQQATGPDSGPAQQAPQQAETQQAPPAERPADDEPVNEAALQHLKKVYDALSLGFPEDKLRQCNLGQARQIVTMWKAILDDHAKGKAPEGSTPEAEMVVFLEGSNLMPDEGSAPVRPQGATPNLEGTIEEVKAWVGDGSDLTKVNQAYEHERTNKARTSLMSWLESKGAGAPPADAQPQQMPAEQVQTPVQSVSEAPAQAPQAPQEQPAPTAAGGVTSVPQQADVPSEDQATQAIEQQLGGVVVDEQVNPEAMCEAEGEPHQIDDVDIAKLSSQRFGKRYCVNHYLAAGRA